MEERTVKNRKGLKLSVSVILTAAVILLAVLLGLSFKNTLENENLDNASLNENYYYLKLSPLEQEAYRAIDNKIDSMPRYILLPNKMNVESVNKVIETFRADNCFSPVMVVDKMSFVDSFLGNYLKISYKISEDEYSKIENEVNEKIENIISQMPKNLSDFEKELYFHDYIVKSTDYKIDKKPLSNTFYGLLVNNESACVGYAQTMKLLLNEVGIECITVCGEAQNGDRKENHMWNQVKLSGEWYNLDATWDDAVGEEPTLTHKFFNLRDSDMDKTHRAYTDVNECNAVSNNYFVKKGLLFDSYDEEAKKKIFSQMAKSKANEPAEVRFIGHDEYMRACKSLVDGDIYNARGEIERISKKQMDIENTGIIRCDSLNIIEFKISYK